MHLRCASRDVDRLDRSARQGGETLLHRFRTHRFASVGARIDVTMPTRLIANLAQVELEHLDRTGRESRGARFMQGVFERRHVRLLQKALLVFRVGERTGLS